MEAEEESPTKKARRPMNAFLIFCKRHRTLVREKNPHLDNRSVTRILGELWAKLSPDEKTSYTTLANEYKEAFMKANPDYKWFNTDKSHPVRNDKPSTRPTNSLVAYHGEIPRSESHENNNGHFQHAAPPTSTHSNYRPPITGVSHPPGAMPRSTAVPTKQQQPPRNTIMDLSKRPPTNTIDGQQMSMAMELMKCVSQANNYSGLPQSTTNQPVSMVTPRARPVAKETSANSQEYGNVSLLHLAKMCSDELESNKQNAKPTEVQSNTLTPPWTPQYDTPYSPTRVETTTAETQGKERTDKENLPNNMQDDKMTLKEFKEQQQSGTASKEHFKNLILSTESDVSTCGKLVVDRVIESIYSQEFGKIEPKPSAGPKATNTVTSTYTPPQQQNQNDTKPSDRLNGLFGVNNAQLLNQKTQTFKTESVDVKDGDKMTLTFGQIQESLIRQAVENSYEFDIASGLKSENIAFLNDSKDKVKNEKSDYSVFDFSSSDVGQNLVEMSSFESRIRSKKYEQLKGAYSSGNGHFIPNQTKPITVQSGMAIPQSAVASSANRLTTPSHTNSSHRGNGHPSPVPQRDGLQYQNRTAMELLQKCDELSRNGDNQIRPNVPSKNPSGWKPNGNTVNLVNPWPANVSPAAAQKSPPVPLKKRKFHLPIETTTIDERPYSVVNKRHERTISADSLNQDENSNDSTGSRKSKRSNRGQRYKALIKQGVLQGSREKTRKNSNGSEAGTPTGEDAPTLANTQPLPCLESLGVQTTSARPAGGGNLLAPRPIRKRTYSEVNTTFTTPSRIRRYTTGDFDLDAHIASLPVVDIDGVGRKNAPRPKPKPKIRHHSESSVLSPNKQTSHCAPVTSQSNALMPSRTSLSPNSNNNKEKMINVAELHKVIRLRKSSDSSDSVRERSNSGGWTSGSAAKRKARKQDITRLIQVSSSQAGEIAPGSSDSKKTADISSSPASTKSSCDLSNGTLSSTEGRNRQTLTCS